MRELGAFHLMVTGARHVYASGGGAACARDRQRLSYWFDLTTQRDRRATVLYRPSQPSALSA